MRRAGRLFDIVQLMRRGKLVRAADLAEALEVSERTIYRDIAALVASGVPIEGEAGVGYVLKGEFDLPPLMFAEDEIEALIFGIRVVEAWGDHALADAATRASRKIDAILPDRLRSYLEETPLAAPPDHWEEPIEIQRGVLRRAIRARQKLAFEYRSKAGHVSRRVIRPLLLSFYGTIWSVTGWCELREDFRSFRLDGITNPDFLPETFEDEPGKRLADLRARPA
ncbi:MAG: YafY family protein [Pseudomonadota bacterium]